MVISMNTIEKKRYTPIQRNYKLLQDHYSDVNALKFLAYLQTKSVEEILEDFECLVTIPNIAAWDMIDELIENADEDYGMLRTLFYGVSAHLSSLENSTVGKNAEEMENTYFQNLIARVRQAHQNLQSKMSIIELDSAPIHVANQVAGEERNQLHEAIVEYTDTLLKVLTEDYDETTMMNMLDDLNQREQTVIETASGLRELSIPSPMDANLSPLAWSEAGSYVIKNYPLRELWAALEKENDILTAETVSNGYTDIVHAKRYDQQLYDRAENQLYAAREAYHNNRLVLVPIEKAIDVLQEAQAMVWDELIPISLFENDGSYLVYDDCDDEVAEIEVDENEDLPSINLDRLNELIEEIDESELPDMEIHEERMTFEAFYEDWCAGNCTNENLFGMLYTTESIQIILEATGRKKEARKLKLSKTKRDKEAKVVHQLKIRAKRAKKLKKRTKATFSGSAQYESSVFMEDSSGRDSIRAKAARKKEEITRKATMAVKKVGRKGEHAAVASKKAAEHVDNLVSSSIQKLLDSPYKQKRDEILKGGFRVKLTGLIKKAIFHTGLFAINPILGAIGLLGAAARDHAVDVRTRREILNELRNELKMIDEKIDDAKSDGNKKEKYQLMRMRSKIESEIERIERHQDPKNNSSNRREND